MSENLRGKLLIISDTPMWANDTIFVHQPTLREVEALSNIFNSITWIGYLHKTAKPNWARNTTNSKIKFIPLNATGGNGLVNKIKQLLYIFNYFFIILKEVEKADIIHTRGPSIPALIYLLTPFTNKKEWHKYAGNWNSQNAFSYKLHKKLLLTRKKGFVTINGKWPDQNENIFSFYNPCFTQTEYFLFSEKGLTKNYNQLNNICFVGRIEKEKGIDKLLDSLFLLSKNTFNTLHIIGEGNEEYVSKIKSKGLQSNIDIIFHGTLNREKLNEIYEKCELLILPSESEGFAKVIIEAGVLGCIPLVSKGSSVEQFITNNVNGFLLENTSKEEIAKNILYLNQHCDKLKPIAVKLISDCSEFTYEKYVTQIDYLLSKKYA